MNTPASITAFVGALLTLLTFWWRLQRERYDVRNRGVNQSPVLTLFYAIRYTLHRLLVYLMLGYLLVSGYYLIKFQHTCQAQAEEQAASYELVDRLLDALRWPVTYQDGPDCLQ